MQEQNNIVNSLAHTKWNCKYHTPRFHAGIFIRCLQAEKNIYLILKKPCAADITVI